MTSQLGEQAQSPLWCDPAERPAANPERSLLDAVANGELDEHLAAIADAVHARQELVHTVRSATAIAELCIGDMVRIKRDVRPRYLFGEFGEIVELDDHGVTVRLVRPVGRFRSGEVRCPPLVLERLDRATSQPAA
jgi:hypothetical protein